MIMKRRHFLRNSSLAGLGLTTLSAVACSSPGSGTASAESDNFTLKGFSIEDLQSKMESGELTSLQITQAIPEPYQSY